ncbi:MAG: NAD(P)/FAD-dependent oxidoreductase [Cellvibrionaceae bacterium]
MNDREKKKVAIIGSGISGLTCAYLLQNYSEGVDFVLFESESRLGGHTATVEVNHKEDHLNIDTGFIVYNDWTYPNFIRLLKEVGVDNQTTDMSFSVTSDSTGIEYSGNNLDTLFAQRKNLISPSFLKMVWNIVRFNKQAISDLKNGVIKEDATLGQYLALNNYSGLFASHYLIPMCSAIWSASMQSILSFPLLFFINFFKNHGLLSINNRPQWRVIKGGSSAYIEPLIQSFKEKIKLATRIANVKREDGSVCITTGVGETFHVDEVVFACHSDQALQLLDDSTIKESEILSAIPYSNNDVVLHTDTNLLPKNKKTWAAWNYLLSNGASDSAVLTYDMNILQSIESQHTYCVTLNATHSIDPEKIIGQYQYAHPQFSLNGVRAQERWSEINGKNNTWFCGAYWRNGFHEDGVVSGMRVAESLGAIWTS